jgi:hypothetical protein
VHGYITDWPDLGPSIKFYNIAVPGAETDPEESFEFPRESKEQYKAFLKERDKKRKTQTMGKTSGAKTQSSIRSKTRKRIHE